MFVLLLVVSILAALLWHSNRSMLPLPPGPRGNLFSGIRSQLPKSEPWKTYAAWGARYGGELSPSHRGTVFVPHLPGPILCYRIYNRLTFVLNTHDAVHELLERRAAIYSGRPVSWMFQVICGRAHAVFNISGLHPRHKIYRRLLQGGLSAQAVKEYWSVIEDEADILIDGLRETPRLFEQHIRRWEI